jgi:flagellar biogenesis protein FliO
MADIATILNYGILIAAILFIGFGGYLIYKRLKDRQASEDEDE